MGMGSVLVPDELRQGELAAFDSTNAAIEFKAQTAAEFVPGSAVPHGCDLVLGSHSVHTTAKARRGSRQSRLACFSRAGFSSGIGAFLLRSSAASGYRTTLA